MDIDGVKVCPSGALTAFGKDYTVDELVSELLADAGFFGECGGVTFSGGECLLQSDFVLECAKELAERKIKIAFDTCGAVDYSSIEKFLPYTDLFLYDIKCISEKDISKTPEYQTEKYFQTSRSYMHLGLGYG